MTQSRQKSYADNCWQKLEFELGDKVFPRISSMKCVMRFGKKGKWSPRYVEPFEITQRVGKIAYLVVLLLDLASMHDVFHVSMLWKYIPNPNYVILYESLEIQEGLTYEEVPVRIMNSNKQVLCTQRIHILK